VILRRVESLFFRNTQLISSTQYSKGNLTITIVANLFKGKGNTEHFRLAERCVNGPIYWHCRPTWYHHRYGIVL